MESEKYAYVNIGGGIQSVYVRIKKEPQLPEADKAKIIAWAESQGFTVSNRKRILRAE